MKLNTLKILDGLAFLVTVVSALVSVLAGAMECPKTAIVFACIAAIAPIINRVANNQLLAPLQARKLTQKQNQIIINKLLEGSSFKVWVAHNRHEAEPAAYHKQFCEALEAGGLEITWFGGMTNTTVGIELSGPESAEKQRLISALDAAGVKYQNVYFSDDPQCLQHGIALWIGVRN